MDSVFINLVTVPETDKTFCYSVFRTNEEGYEMTYNEKLQLEGETNLQPEELLIIFSQSGEIMRVTGRPYDLRAMFFFLAKQPDTLYLHLYRAGFLYKEYCAEQKAIIFYERDGRRIQILDTALNHIYEFPWTDCPKQRPCQG